MIAIVEWQYGNNTASYCSYRNERPPLPAWRCRM